jgi:HPr kinase/phosphorylase
MEKKILVEELVHDIKFRVIAGETGLKHAITSEMVDHPSLELTGFFDYFTQNRIYLIGSKEQAFLRNYPLNEQTKRMETLIQRLPAVIAYSKNVDPSDAVIALANHYQVPVIKSNIETTPLSSMIHTYLHEKLARSVSVHGVLVSINGMGVLLLGSSGIGKSEVAVELIKKGHILISDDRVNIHEVAVGHVVGETPKLLRGLVEVRGIGVVDVVRMFGASSYKDSSSINLVCELEVWTKEKAYNRVGLETEYITYFNTSIPKVMIPVSPGRSAASLVETAALNQKLKDLGFNAADDLAQNLEKEIELKRLKSEQKNEN